jgi:hypothetical protein
LSLGGGNGYVIVDMGENEEILDGSGADLKVYEVGAGCNGINEGYYVYVSNNSSGPWILLGTGSGNSTFDLAGNLSRARYVKIVDQNPNVDNGGSTPGADIDAIEALHYNSPIPTPTGPTPTNTSTPTNTPTSSTPTATPTQPSSQEMVIPGWIGSPAQQATVSGIVPITLANNITLQSGMIDYWPANDVSQLKVLDPNVSGNGGVRRI